MRRAISASSPARMLLAWITSASKRRAIRRSDSADRSNRRRPPAVWIGRRLMLSSAGGRSNCSIPLSRSAVLSPPSGGHATARTCSAGRPFSSRSIAFSAPLRDPVWFAKRIRTTRYRGRSSRARRRSYTFISRRSSQ